MKQWKVFAPNGLRVIVSTGPYVDTEFRQGDIITNADLAITYPTIFRYIGDPEEMMENKKGPQILTEVPKPRPFEPETDKPDQDKESSDDDDSDIVSFLKKEVDELNSDSLDEKYTKKQLELICADFNIETKKLTKGKIIENILAEA